MTIKPWEVWFAAVRFEDSPQIKNRPVVVTSSEAVCVMALKVTSHVPRNEWGEYALQHWQAAGLNKPSTVRIGKRLRDASHVDVLESLVRLLSVSGRRHAGSAASAVCDPDFFRQASGR